MVRSPEEQRTFANVMLIAWLENLCRHSLGRYVPLEQLVAGCGGVSLAEENSPARDPDYEYRLSVRGDSLELSVMPRRPGLGGFFSDGRKIYYNPAGPASPRDYRNVMEAPGAR